MLDSESQAALYCQKERLGFDCYAKSHPTSDPPSAGALWSRALATMLAKGQCQEAEHGQPSCP